MATRHMKQSEMKLVSLAFDPRSHWATASSPNGVDVRVVQKRESRLCIRLEISTVCKRQYSMKMKMTVRVRVTVPVIVL